MPNINVAILSNKAVSGAGKVNRALDSIGKKALSIAGSAFTPFNAALATIASGAGVVGVSKIADEFTVMATQLEFVTGSAEAAAKAEKKLYDISKVTGTSMKDNADTFVKLSQASAMTGLSMEQNYQVLGSINALMIKTGTSGAQASAAMLQLSQALTSGKLQGDEFRSMAENAPGVLAELSKAMGIPRSELKAMATAGELTSEKLGQAFLDISESAQGSFEGLPETAAHGWNAVVLAFREAWDQINDDTGIMGELRQGLLNLADWIEEKTPVFSQWFQDMVSNIQENWPGIQATLFEFKDAVIEMYNSAAERLPSMGEFFSGLATVITYSYQALTFFIEKFTWVIDNWDRIVQFVDWATLGLFSGAAAAAGTLAGGGSVGDAWDAWGESGEETQEGGNPFSITNNFNQSLSKGDIVDITTRQKQQGARL